MTHKLTITEKELQVLKSAINHYYELITDVDDDDEETLNVEIIVDQLQDKINQLKTN
jgi:hypothetical protein